MSKQTKRPVMDKHKSKAAIGAKVQYCGHEGWFIADIFHFNSVVAIKANGSVTPKNIVRNRMCEATHTLHDFPKAGLWCPDRGIFVVPEDQVTELHTRGL